MYLSSSPFPATIGSTVCAPLSSWNPIVHGFKPPSSRVSRSVVVMTTTHSSNASILSHALSPPAAKQDQIGIISFLLHKNYFITGATGFLAKVLVEKMLRTVPDVGNIYLLIKAKDKESAIKRLKSEIIESDLFKCLRQKHGESYEEWMMSKLIPIVGDVSKDNLGMDAESAATLAKEIDVIVNSAANTTFDERYDVALNTNTKGPARLINFAHKCHKLSVFLHISTAYANGEREGIVTEKPFLMGQSIAQERFVAASDPLDLNAEIELASRVLQSVNVKEATQAMKELGSQRARKYGWQNVYVLSKAMGEMVVNSERGDIPVVIFRPSVVESTYREPFPGWIQGNRMLDPLILSYAKHQLPGFLADPEALIDVVPADMVVNAAIVAMAKHGIAAKPELNVYHMASSIVNPLSLGDVFNFSCDHFSSYPLLDSKGADISISDMEFLSSMDEFAPYICNEIEKQSGLLEGTFSDPSAENRVQKLCNKKAEHIIRLAKMYQPYMFYKGWFGNGNTQKLMKEMSIEEMWDFGFDVRGVNWKHYFMNIHIPGLKRHVLMMKGDIV